MRRDPRTGPYLLAACGAILVASGFGAVALALTIKLLPNDIETLGMSIDELDRFAGGRIVDFMAHDRLAMAGAFIAIGILYFWLATVPLRNGEAWAWWTLAITGVIGFASFLSYLGYGYLDWIHALATLCLLAVFATGMALSRDRLRAPSGARDALAVRFGELTAPWRRGERPPSLEVGRALLLALALGSIGSGAVIVGLGMTGVFVPQDLDFIGLTRGEVDAIDPQLIPVIAHDRAEFGGGLVCIGLILAMLALYALRPGAAALWWALVAALACLAAGAIFSHPAIGYTDFFHLLPTYGSLALSIVVVAVLRRPLVPGTVSSHSAHPA